MATVPIRIRRHQATGAVAPPAPAEDGVITYAQGGYTNPPVTPGNDLIISQGGTNRTLISAARQVELTGAQNITGQKTFSTASLLITGGTPGQALTALNGAGGITYTTLPPPGLGQVEHDVSMLGQGTAANELTLNPAVVAEINAGTDNVKAISPVGLRSQMGLPNSQLTTTATSIVPAINELVQRIDALAGVALLVGAYDVVLDAVHGIAGGPIPDGDPLPPSSGANTGWYVIASVAGTGTGNAPAEAIAVGDWLISTGTAWLHLEMHVGTITASNVTITPIPPLTATDVQTALEQIQTRKIETIFVDNDTIGGDGLGAATPLRVMDIDGGTIP